MEFGKLKAPAAVIAAIGAVALAVISIPSAHVNANISYPYVCADCGAVFDVSELKEDYPRNWRIPERAPSDSVVLCIKCNKGWARPVATCETCKTQYILYMGDNRCPKCFPEAAEKVRKATGKESVFKAP